MGIKSTMILPPAAVEPCEENLRNPNIDWDLILAGGPVNRESCRQVAGLVLLKLLAEEYDALASELDGESVPTRIRETPDTTTIAPEPIHPS
jgi:hypothetical protein